jgi:hypothetical protein
MPPMRSMLSLTRPWRQTPRTPQARPPNGSACGTRRRAARGHTRGVRR